MAHNITPGHKLEVRVLGLCARIADVGPVTGADKQTVEEAAGTLEATIGILIPNRRVSGDFRMVTKAIKLANIEYFPLEDGDGI